MLTATLTAPTSKNRDVGIRYWMERVIAERSKVEAGFDADPVHDFRVAIRRCRSIAEGFREVDPNPNWNKMRKAGKVVFAAFGELRDVQVLTDWVRHLQDASPPFAEQLLAYCLSREQDLQDHAAAALHSFDEGQWLRWSEMLEKRTRKIGFRSEVFQVIALQKWETARTLHRLAVRNHSKVSFHRLRVGIKRFRYFVENFLPDQHERWSRDLKLLQDLLGEVHDLDVLWATTQAQLVAPDVADRDRWHAAIEAERQKRLIAYREKMSGRSSLWHLWRAGLPAGDALRRAVLKRFENWALLLGSDPTRSKQVLNFSLTIYDSLSRSSLLTASELDGVPARDLLSVAALVHEAGRGKGARKHHKRSRRLLTGLAPPPGWTTLHLQAVGLIVRYHRGALPSPDHKAYKVFPSKSRPVVDELAAVLRLASAFNGRDDESVQHIRVQREQNVIVIRAAGYRERSATAERVAAARYLLEQVTGLPVFITGDHQ